LKPIALGDEVLFERNVEGKSVILSGSSRREKQNSEIATSMSKLLGRLLTLLATVLVVPAVLWASRHRYT